MSGFYFIILFSIPNVSARFNYKNECSYFWGWFFFFFTWLREKNTDNAQWWGLLLSEDVSFSLYGSCLILKWNSSVTFVHYLMFMHVECFILLNANPLLCLIARPFETFWEAPSFVLRATRHSWIFHFLLRLLPVITRLCSPRTYNYRRYTLCLRHTHTHTHFICHTCPHFSLHTFQHMHTCKSR